MKIAVASKNPVKINSLQKAFALSFPAEEIEVSSLAANSGVSDQPFGEEETLRGALNRLTESREAFPKMDYYSSIEGGLIREEKDLYVFAWVVIEDHKGIQSRSQAARFKLPENLASLVRQGKELGDADNIVYGRSNSKQGDGTVGILTNQLVTRTGYYEHAAILAICSFAKS